MSQKKINFNSVWPQIRAVLITIHLIAISLAAMPSPAGGMKKEYWATPVVQAEFDNWTKILQRSGVSVNKQELQQVLWTLAEKIVVLRNTTLKPFRPYYNHLGTSQPWQMFVAPHRFPAKLQLDLKSKGKWEPLYRPLSKHRWQASVLESSRFRSVIFRYAWKRYRSYYRQLCRWLSRQAAREFPEAKLLRVRWLRQKTPTPEQVLDKDIPLATAEQTFIGNLEKYR